MSHHVRTLFAGAVAAMCAACTLLAALDAHEGASGGDVDGGGGGTDANGGVDGGGGDTAVLADGALPASCIGVLRAAATPRDGDYTIDPDGAGPIPPFKVYCAGMDDGGVPREYLTLASPDNYTTYAHGGQCDPCSDYTRTFRKVRLDLGGPTLAIDITDTTFSDGAYAGTSCPANAQACQGPTGTWYASPGSCVAIGDASGTAHVDLSQTGFHVATSRWEPIAASVDGGGDATTSPDGHQVTITGGGYCGTLVPAPAYLHRLAIAHD